MKRKTNLSSKRTVRRKSRAIWNVTAFCILLCALHAEPAPAIQLPEYLAIAEEHAPGLRATALRLSALEHEIAALPRWYLPELYVEAGYGGAANDRDNRHGVVGRLVGEWTLWDGGRRDAERAFNRQRQALVRAEDAMLRLGVRKHLAFAYYRLSYNRSLIALMRAEIAACRRLQNRIYPRLRIGTSNAADLSAVRLRIGILRADSEALQSQFAVLQGNLAILAGLDPDAAAGDTASDSANEATQRSPMSSLANRSLPLLEQAFVPEYAPISLEQHPRYRVQQAELGLLAARTQALERELYGGSLSFETYGGYAPYTGPLEPNRPEVGAGVRFRFPLYASRDRASQLAAGEERLEAERLSARQRLLELRAELRARLVEIRVDREELVEVDGFLPTADRAIRQALASYSRGQGGANDALEAIHTSFELKRHRLSVLLRLRLAEFEQFELANIAQFELANTAQNDLTDTGEAQTDETGASHERSNEDEQE